MPQVKPKKALGQHFLTDPSIADRIASTLDEYAGTPVMEVGPGMGILTRFLLDRGHDINVAEIDSESIEYLKDNFPELDNRIVAGDFLQLDLRKFYDGHSCCVIGNYPYNISSQIFFHVLEYKDIVKCCSGMLQREVAERLAAPPGTKTRGILSVLLQVWYDVQYLFTVSEKVFNPPPKVKSGVIKMVRNNVTDIGCDERLFKTVVKTTFGQRRKTIRNTIKSLVPPGSTLPDDCDLLSLRPEQLSVDQFIQLTLMISKFRGQ